MPSLCSQPHSSSTTPLFSRRGPFLNFAFFSKKIKRGGDERNERTIKELVCALISSRLERAHLSRKVRIFIPAPFSSLGLVLVLAACQNVLCIALHEMSNNARALSRARIRGWVVGY